MDMLLYILLYDAWLYWGHRLLHVRWRKIHAVHHQDFTGLHFHWAEHLFLWGPLVLAPLVGWWFAGILYVVLYFGSLASHKRMYNWLNLPTRKRLELWITPRFHLIHHRDSRSNYGLLLNIWDYLAGTKERD